MSACISFTAGRFFSFWLFIELNLVRFLRFISQREACPSLPLKYFIPQANFSVLIFYCYTLQSVAPSLRSQLGAAYFIIVAGKMGVPPFHMWLVRLMLKRDWLLVFLLSSVQKVIPVLLLSGTALSQAHLLLGWAIFSLMYSGVVILSVERIKGYFACISVFRGG